MDHRKLNILTKNSTRPCGWVLLVYKLPPLGEVARSAERVYRLKIARMLWKNLISQPNGPVCT